MDSEDVGCDIEEVDEPHIQSPECQADSGSPASRPRAKKFKQSTLDGFIGTPSTSRTVISSPVARKRCTGNRKPFSVTTSVVDEGEKKTVRRIQAAKTAIPSPAVFVDTLDPEQPCCSSSEISRMGATIKKAKRESLYGQFEMMTTNNKTEKKSKALDETSGEGAESLEDDEHKRKLDSCRCFEDLYPDLKSLSSSDVVMVGVDSIKPGEVPKPFPPSCLDRSLGWSKCDQYVRLPFSSDSVFDRGTNYSRIEEMLTQLVAPLQSHYELEDCIRSINSSRNWNLDAIGELFENFLDESLKKEYLKDVIPFIAKLALSAPTLITQPIPLLRRGCVGSVTFSQQQVAALLAHAFFCTFDHRDKWESPLPAINLNCFFDARRPLAIEKLKCILHYFHRISKNMPTGIISYRRQFKEAPDWKSFQTALCDFVVVSSGTIEDDGFGMLEMDFANKYIGGGVLRSGCVQEEIRFLICPELILSCLFCERMDFKEAIVIGGAQRYSDYTGYGGNFKWRARTDPLGSVARDRFERYLCEVVAIDALSYSRKRIQYNVKAVDRELQKAYSGFYAFNGSKKGVATGNWGCGVYGGDPHLKGLIQLIAASVNSRPVCYFTFYNQQLANELRAMYAALKRHEVTVGSLYSMVVDYCRGYSPDSPPLFTYMAERISERGGILH